MEFKYTELMTMVGIIEVQITSLEQVIDDIKDEVELKVMKGELVKLKPIRTKMKKMIADY